MNLQIVHPNLGWSLEQVPWWCHLQHQKVSYSVNTSSRKSTATPGNARSFDNNVKSGGWTNLLSHLHSCVGKDYEQAFVDHQKLIASSSTTAGYFLRISKHEKEMFNWINFIVMKNLPVSFVDCSNTRDITRLKPISAQKLRCHILSLLSVVKENNQG